MSINWTKDWSNADNGTILEGVDLRNIQNDLENVLQTSDIGVTVAAFANYNWVCNDNAVVCYDNNVVYV